MEEGIIRRRRRKFDKRRETNLRIAVQKKLHDREEQLHLFSKYNLTPVELTSGQKAALWLKMLPKVKESEVKVGNIVYELLFIKETLRKQEKRGSFSILLRSHSAQQENDSFELSQEENTKSRETTTIVIEGPHPNPSIGICQNSNDEKENAGAGKVENEHGQGKRELTSVRSLELTEGMLGALLLKKWDFLHITVKNIEKIQVSVDSLKKTLRYQIELSFQNQSQAKGHKRHGSFHTLISSTDSDGELNKHNENDKAEDREGPESKEREKYAAETPVENQNQDTHIANKHEDFLSTLAPIDMSERKLMKLIEEVQLHCDRIFVYLKKVERDWDKIAGTLRMQEERGLWKKGTWKMYMNLV